MRDAIDRERTCWVELLKDIIVLRGGLTVPFHPAMPPHAQRLMEALGVRVVFDEKVPPGERW